MVVVTGRECDDCGGDREDVFLLLYKVPLLPVTDGMSQTLFNWCSVCFQFQVWWIVALC